MTSITHSRVKSGITALVLSCLAAGPLRAEALALPSNANLTFEQVKNQGSYAAPVAPYSGGLLPVSDVTGRVTKQAYRIPQQGVTPQQILTPLEESLAGAGFEILFKCQDRLCGGFDFRFATDVVAAPDMFVDLFDYIFLTARRAPPPASAPKGASAEGSAQETAEFVTLLASRDASAGYVQIVQVLPDGAEPLQTAASAPLLASPESAFGPPQAALSGEGLSAARFESALESRGHLVLGDLTFETGAAQLGAGPFESLATLAGFLLADDNRRVVLVGHTDATGALEGNIALSKRRAGAVMERLAAAYGVPPAQMQAEGMGYLSPVTSNLTDAGREANRRVEVILLNTD